MKDGWVKIYRKILKNPTWTTGKFSKGQAMVDLLLLANHKPKKVTIRGITLNTGVGELAYSIHSLAERWRWNERSAKRFLIGQETAEFIQCRNSNVTTIISIKNYASYQSGAVQNTVQSAVQSAVQTASKQEVSIKEEDKKSTLVLKLKDTPIKPKSEAKVRVKQPPDPRIQVIIDYFHDTHLTKTGKKPLFLVQDFPSVKRILRVAGVDAIKGYIDKFFLDQDRFLCDKGKSLNTFCVHGFSRYHSKTGPLPDGDYDE